MESIVVAFLTGVLGPIIVIFVREWLNKRPKPDMISEAVELGNQITHRIDEIKEEFGCDRIWIAQFHNGGHFYPTGKSIAKFSIVYESLEPGTTSIQHNFQNIPVSLFSRAINQLLENDVIEVKDYKDPTVATYGMKDAADSAGSKSSYLFAIKNIEGKFIGALCIDYVKRKKELSHDEVNQVLVYTTQIGGVLNAHLNKQ